jgi:hypothetical protein
VAAETVDWFPVNWTSRHNSATDFRLIRKTAFSCAFKERVFTPNTGVAAINERLWDDAAERRS